MTEETDVTVVIVNCNGVEDTLICLDSIEAADVVPQQVIVVDNGSTDDSVERLGARQSSRVELIPLPHNQGPAAARNVAVGRARNPVLAFLDNDTTVEAAWLRNGIAALRDLGADCIQCKLILADDPRSLDSTGHLLGPCGFPRHLARPGTRDDGSFAQPRRLFGVKSAGMLITKPAFQRANGFDDSYFIYGEETDLCWRLFRAGGTVFYAPTSVVRHAPGGTARSLPGDFERLLYRGGTRNYIRTVVKNAAPGTAAVGVVGQILVWALVAVAHLLRRRPRRGLLVARGIADAASEIPRLLSGRRRDELPFPKIPRELRAPFSIGYIREVLNAA